MRHWLLSAAAAVTMLVGAPVVAAKGPALAALLANPARPEADKVRDADRKPAEVMAFAGIRPGAKVAELYPGGGYYTRLLSAAVGPSGYVYTFATRASPAVAEIARGAGNVSVGVGKPGDSLAPEPVDVVWTTQNYHDFKNMKVEGGDAAMAFNKAAFAALKPGGIYLINDHQAAPGAGATVTSTLHRIEDAAVIREVEAAGFRLEGRSAILRHPADDHTAKVFDSGVRGKTDQFLLRFRKPRR